MDGYKYLEKYYSLMGRDLMSLSTPLYDNTTPDFSGRYNKRLESFGNIVGNDLDKRIDEANNVVLWVIDMQNDFLDAQLEDVRLKSTDGSFVIENILVPEKNDEKETIILPSGRFAVKEGTQCIDDVLYYLNYLKTYREKGNKSPNEKFQFIFSRDLHTSKKDDTNHCSFKPSSNNTWNGAGFPAHCVNGTKGCQLHEDIEQWIKENETELHVNVSFKGFNRDVESFGAYPYICNKDDENNKKPFLDKYVMSRQQNKCSGICSDGIINDSGSFMFFNSENKNAEKLENQLYKNENTINLENYKESIVSIKNIMEGVNPDKSKTLHLVCGLAGDFCVRDTAFNLMADGYENTFILADATRYACLPYNYAIKNWFSGSRFMNNAERIQYLIKKYQMNPIASGKSENNKLKTCDIFDVIKEENEGDKKEETVYEFFLTPPVNMLLTYGFTPMMDRPLFLVSDKNKMFKNKSEKTTIEQTVGGKKAKRRNRIKKIKKRKTKRSKHTRKN